MDEMVESMLNGFKTVYENVENAVGAENAADFKAIIDEMFMLAGDVDYAGFMSKATETGVLNRYNEELAKMSSLASEMNVPLDQSG
jgi:hypothetical protein